MPHSYPAGWVNDIAWATIGLAGIALPADYLLDFALAWSLGIVFLAFQAGLFAGMAIHNLGIWNPPLPHDSATYWMLMRLSMILGFVTAMPVNVWLIRKGWKEQM